MHICICLRGIHYSDDTIIADYRKSLNNYRDYIINPLKSLGHTIDIMIFTYDSTIINQLIFDYDPCGKVILVNSDRYIDTSWNRQLIFHNYSIKAIKNREDIMKYKYDCIINTRFDLEFNTKITEMNIDYSMFNIAFKHSSGNCDDNLWIFPGVMIDEFESAINNLYKNSQMTHEINKYMPIINYMYETQNTYLYWSFLRSK